MILGMAFRISRFREVVVNLRHTSSTRSPQTRSCKVPVDILWQPQFSTCLKVWKGINNRRNVSKTVTQTRAATRTTTRAATLKNARAWPQGFRRSAKRVALLERACRCAGARSRAVRRHRALSDWQQIGGSPYLSSRSHRARSAQKQQKLPQIYAARPADAGNRRRLAAQ